MSDWSSVFPSLLLQLVRDINRLGLERGPRHIVGLFLPSPQLYFLFNEIFRSLSLSLHYYTWSSKATPILITWLRLF